MFNTGVYALKIDEVTGAVIGTVDDGSDDPTVYDHVIMTAELNAVQSIFNRTYEIYNQNPIIEPVLVKCNNETLGQLKMAPDYKVMRIWFDKQMNASAPDILETPDYTPINLIAQYHLLEAEFANWANRTGGSVVEFHIYTWSKYFDTNVTDDQVWSLISPTVQLIYPEIFDRNFSILAYNVNSYQNFASFEHGLFFIRPYTDTFAKNNLTNFYLGMSFVLSLAFYFYMYVCVFRLLMITICFARY